MRENGARETGTELAKGDSISAAKIAAINNVLVAIVLSCSVFIVMVLTNNSKSRVSDKSVMRA